MTTSTSIEARLQRTFEAAQRKAREGQSRELACIAAEIDGLDPLAVFNAALPQSRLARTFWHQPDAGLTMVALGAAGWSDLSGSSRFAEARAKLRRSLAEAVVENDSDLSVPVALGGFAFSATRKAGAAMPDGRFTIPRLMVVQHQSTTTLVAAEVIDADTDVAELARAFEADIARLVAVSKELALPEQLPLRSFETTTRDEWDAGIATILSAIETGEVEKVVLARTVLLEAEEAIPVAPALRRLGERFPHCTIFAFQQGERCFLGATPERLLRIEGDAVQIDCLAGSIARGQDEVEDERLASKLLDDPKERHEHAVVARAIREALAPVCETVEAPDAPVIYRAANVQHLHTPFVATAKPGHDVFDLVERLHPTPATGGYPRETALAVQARCESFDRDWYAAPVGWIDAAGNGEFVVAIRSALVEGKRATLYAGGGIVEGSDPSREYEETALKLQTMLWALQPQ